MSKGQVSVTSTKRSATISSRCYRTDQSLDETTLAERIGLSQSTVREALIRLAGDNLVEGHLLTYEHHEMLAAIRAGDIERADTLAHLHVRQFRHNFIDFMKRSYLSEASLAPMGRPGRVSLVV